MAVQKHIFLHMGAVHADPLPVHAVDVHFPVLDGLGVAQDCADVVLGLPVLLDVRVLHHAVDALDQVHQVLGPLVHGACLLYL